MRISTTPSLLVLVSLLLIPVPALAAPAITCHCFTERSFDPQRPTLADPYFLANAQNSFFAAAFGVEKKTVVMKKQRGASSDDLWVAYWLAAKSGADPEALLKERPAKGSWRLVAAELSLAPKTLGPRVAEALKGSAPDERIAQAVVDQLLLQYRVHSESDLALLRKGGAGNQELVLSGLLAPRLRLQATRFHEEVKKGATSWGALLQRGGMDPSEIQPEAAALVRRSGAAGAK